MVLSFLCISCGNSVTYYSVTNKGGGIASQYMGLTYLGEGLENNKTAIKIMFTINTDGSVSIDYGYYFYSPFNIEFTKDEIYDKGNGRYEGKRSSGMAFIFQFDASSVTISTQADNGYIIVGTVYR
ncbi:hypothetical protein [Brachyspira sp. G79]|uniref:hypothetical protein n=1 Tax=Brachyspira sp. G79 TaxID=1358104 RepID=UPI000BBBF717|nr:hypothetical protein [Brachyspira sp. G79]PCG21019.1 hypothetical protein KQ44_01070 [Brachyspira sp. G79]